MEYRPVSAGRTSPIHYPDGRDRFLDAISQPGATLDSAAESIGTSVKTVRRFALDHPEWAEQIERARNGLVWQREGGRVLACPPASSVIEGVPCGAPELERPAETYNGITRAQYDAKLAEVFDDDTHPHWPHVMKVYATLFDGPEIIRARRRAELEQAPGDGERRTVFVFVSKSSALP
jgi:hypothetical protein